MQTLLDLFNSFESRHEKTALIYRTGVRRFPYSYSWLQEQSLRMAGLLLTNGVGKGDRVVLWGPNSPWWVVTFWGITVRGAIVVPVDFMAGQDRAENIARLTNASLVIQSRSKLTRIENIPSLWLEDLEYVLPTVSPLRSLADSQPSDTAQLIYTSGTTGNPKGVILTHRNLMENLSQVNRHIPVVTSNFTFLSLLPLSHMFEQMGGFFIPLCHGAAIVYLRTLKPSAIMEAFGEEDIHAVIAVPRLLQLLKNSVERELAAKHLMEVFRMMGRIGQGLSRNGRKFLFAPLYRKFGRNFVLFVSGGAALDPEVFAFWDNTGFTVVEGYGLTECSPVLSANIMDRQQAGSVGKALPGVDLTLVNGEVLARGANISPGYYQNESATREAFTEDGWFRTGDLGFIDSEGLLHIRGRSKDVIVTGAGINVYPDDIENVLSKVAGIRESCVIGLERGSGEEVHAVLVLDGSGRKADGIIREANDRLDSLQQITGYSIWTEGDLPKTTTLKVRKFLVKEMLQVEKERRVGGGGVDSFIALIAKVTGVPPAEIHNDSFLVSNLGLTSIGRLELVNYLEQEYRLDLEESMIGPQTRVADLRSLVDRREKPSGKDRFRFWSNAPVIKMVRRCCDALLNYPLFRCFVSLDIHGLENLADLRSPVFFIANHTSYFDQPAIMFSLPRSWRYRTATAAWAEFFFMNYHNILQRTWKRFTYEYGTIGLNLFPLPQSYGFRSTLQHMGKLIDNGINLLVFPEGERSKDGSMLPFQKGLGLMVKELAVPVMPVKIIGLEKVYPRGALWPKRGKVSVYFGVPMEFRQEGPDEIVALARQAVKSLGEKE